MKLNEKQIAALEEKGFRRWTKGTMDRLYINAETLGLELDYYKSGNISSATYRGESISNRRGGEMRAAKTYIDIETGELHSTNWTLEQDAQQLYDETMEALEATEATETTETTETIETTEITETTETTETDEEDDTMYSIFTEIENMNTCHINGLEEAREIAATYRAQGHDYEIRDEETGETVDSYIRDDEEETSMKLTDEQIDRLEDAGFRLNEATNCMRLSYRALGLDPIWYSMEFRGVTYSQAEIEDLIAAAKKTYIDANTGKLHSENSIIYEAAAELMAQALR